jgi:hypothetical protein
MNITQWVDARIKAAVDAANADLKADLAEQFSAVNTSLDGIAKDVNSVSATVTQVITDGLARVSNGIGVVSDSVSRILNLIPHL